MQVGLSTIDNLSNTNRLVDIDAYNLSSSLIYAVDIYFTCEDTATYNAILTPINGTPNITVIIDDIPYPIQFGYPGESSTNPIIFKRQSSFSKVHFKTGSNTFEMIGYNSSISGTPHEQLSDVGSGVLGTNVDVQDSIGIQIVLSNLLTLNTSYFSFGGKEISGTINDGFGGVGLSTDTHLSNNKNVEGFGGIMPDPLTQNIIFAIERSAYSDILNGQEVTYGIS